MLIVDEHLCESGQDELRLGLPLVMYVSEGSEGAPWGNIQGVDLLFDASQKGRDSRRGGRKLGVSERSHDIRILCLGK